MNPLDQKLEQVRQEVEATYAAARMTVEDRARAAQRLLDDPLAMAYIASLEMDARDSLLVADTDMELREYRNTMLALKALKGKLRLDAQRVSMSSKTPAGVV